jgi:hypothetical protein
MADALVRDMPMELGLELELDPPVWSTGSDLLVESRAVHLL